VKHTSLGGGCLGSQLLRMMNWIFGICIVSVSVASLGPLAAVYRSGEKKGVAREKRRMRTLYLRCHTSAEYELLTGVALDAATSLNQRGDQA